MKFFRDTFLDFDRKVPLAIILVGLPGSGKSTFVNELRGDFEVASTDSYIEKEAMRLGKAYTEVFSDTISDATRDMYGLVEQCFKHRVSVVWDQTNLGLKKRANILGIIPDGYVPIAVYFEIPEDIRQERLKNRPGKVIPEHVDKSMRDSYVRPSLSEGFLAVYDGESL